MPSPSPSDPCRRGLTPSSLRPARCEYYPEFTLQGSYPTADRRMSAQTGVRVQPGDHDVDNEEVERHRPECQQVDPGRLDPTPACRGPCVQVCGVAQPRDERPGLLRVPAPVPAPGRLRPDRSGDDRECPDGEAEGHGPVGDPVEQ